MVTRKCGVCGQLIEIDRVNSNGAILYKKFYYHDPCFAQLCADKVANSRTQKTWAGVYEGVEQYRENARKMGEEACVKDDIFKWMCEKYCTEFVDSMVYQKLSDIYAGKWRGLIHGISPATILAMWKYYWGYLQEVHKYNDSHGKQMDSNAQIKYDLSILLNKYNEYQQKMAIQAAETKIVQETTAQPKINYAELYKHKETTGTDDSLNMFNEIFGD